MKTLLEQSVYDALDESLARNGQALNDHFLKNLRRKIASSAKTTHSGVEVKTEFLEWALEAIQRIVTINGEKYNSSPDKMLIYDLKEAIRPLDDLIAEEVTVVPIESDIGLAKTTPPDAITSAESLNVACSIAPDQQPTTTEAYTFPPTPVCGKETGRQPHDYPTFTRHFIWSLVQMGRMRENFIDRRKKHDVPPIYSDYNGNPISNPTLSRTTLHTSALFG